MGTWSKMVLSGSTHGSILSVATTDTTLHTAVTGSAGSVDEVWAYAWRNNADQGSQLRVTIGTSFYVFTSSDSVNFGERGADCIVPGIVVRNSVVISARATTLDAWRVIGFVNRFST